MGGRENAEEEFGLAQAESGRECDAKLLWRTTASETDRCKKERGWRDGIRSSVFICGSLNETKLSARVLNFLARSKLYSVRNSKIVNWLPLATMTTAVQVLVFCYHSAQQRERGRLVIQGLSLRYTETA